MNRRLVIVIPKSHEPPRAIYSPEAALLLSRMGDITIRRASHVDVLADLSPAAQAAARLITTDENSHWADLSPVGGPLLGPFSERETALTQEVDWLLKNNIPTPPTGEKRAHDGSPCDE